MVRRISGASFRKNRSYRLRLARCEISLAAARLTKPEAQRVARYDDTYWSASGVPVQLSFRCVAAAEARAQCGLSLSHQHEPPG